MATNFIGDHEVDEHGLCVWCKRWRVGEPDFGCDLKGRILLLEVQIDNMNAHADRISEKLDTVLAHLRGSAH